MVFAIRDFEGVDKFEWWMHHTLTPLNGSHDCLTFHMGQPWPTGKLISMVIDFVIFKQQPNIRVIRKRAVDYQTHLDVPINASNPAVLLLFPVSFSDFSLTGGFSNMAIPEYSMYAIHYMHMHNGKHS